MFEKIYEELTAIRKEIQAIRSSQELLIQMFNKKEQMSKEEIEYRSMTVQQRQAVKWALSLEKNSEALNTIKRLYLLKNSDNII